jgi:hypothetical protein
MEAAQKMSTKFQLDRKKIFNFLQHRSTVNSIKSQLSYKDLEGVVETVSIKRNDKCLKRQNANYFYLVITHYTRVYTYKHVQ